MTPEPKDRPQRTRRRIAGERRPRTQVEESAGRAAESTAAEEAAVVPEVSGAGGTERVVEPPAEAEAPSPPPSTETAPGWIPPSWLLIGVAVLAVVAVALAGWSLVGYLDARDELTDQQSAVDRALLEAPAAAEKAAVPVLSYKWDTLEQDIAKAQGHLSDAPRPKGRPSMRDAYTKSMRDLVSGPAQETKVVVQAKVLESGVINAGADRVEVLLFVDQTTSNVKDKGKTALNRVQFTMVEEGDRWLVHEITSF